MRIPRTIANIPSRFVLAVSLLTGLYAPSATYAQVPDEFTNLKVLHEDITQGELLSIMKSFTQALGVRCEHCHVGQPGQPLAEFDFASDDKVEKRTARVMMTMINTINDDHLTLLDSAGGHKPHIVCATCHRGQIEPETIREVMYETYDAGGIDSMMSSYRALRSEHYGSAGYDFREKVLLGFAADLAQRQRLDDAMKVLDMDAELFPESGDSYMFKGLVHLQNGNEEAAIESLTRALQIDPDNQGAKMQLERLRKK